MRFVVLLAFGLGCVSKDDAEREIRVAAGVVVEAITAGLIMTETFGYIDPRGARHGPSTSCPSRELTGSDIIYVMLLDYEASGCEAESGWVPWLMGGHYWVDVDQGSVGWTRLEDVAVGGLSVTGAPSGSWGVSDTGWGLDVSGPIAWEDTELELDLSITFDGRDPSMTMSGSVEARQGTLTLDGVTMHRADVQTLCPSPRAGTFSWSGDLELDLSVQGTHLQGEVGGHSVRSDLCRQGPLFSSGG
jgi:hypothetical protein